MENSLAHLSPRPLTRAVSPSNTRKSETAVLPPNTILVATSGIATGLGLLLQWFGFKDGWQPDAAFLVAIVTGGWLVFPKALRSLRSLSLDMNVLMTVAVLGAIAIGEHAEGAAVAFLFSLSELLESWSVGRARRAIEALMELTPDTALVKQDGEWREVAATEVQPGEIFLVKPGQKGAARRRSRQRKFLDGSIPHHW